jgi:type IV secretory pathway TrbD component
MTEFRRVPVHRSLTRQQLLAGCDRELFFLLAMFCGLLLMSGAARLYWRNIVLAAVFWVAGIPALAKIAIYDAHFKGVVFRSTRYLRYCLPANGRPGIRPVTHRRWD